MTSGDCFQIARAFPLLTFALASRVGRIRVVIVLPLNEMGKSQSIICELDDVELDEALNGLEEEFHIAISDLNRQEFIIIANDAPALALLSGEAEQIEPDVVLRPCERT